MILLAAPTTLAKPHGGKRDAKQDGLRKNVLLRYVAVAVGW